MHLLVEQEVGLEDWEPVGIGQAESMGLVADAVAALARELIPGRFRYLPSVEADAWRHLELDADGRPRA
jgi:hypothetical protein